MKIPYSFSYFMCFGLLAGQISRLHLCSVADSFLAEVVVLVFVILWISLSVFHYWSVQKMHEHNEMDYRFNKAWNECMHRLIDVKKQFEIGMIDHEQRDKDLAAISEDMNIIMMHWHAERAALRPKKKTVAA